MKRRYSGYVRSRRWDRQFKEILMKHIVYNIERRVRFLIFILSFRSPLLPDFSLLVLILNEDFYKAVKIENLLAFWWKIHRIPVG